MLKTRNNFNEVFIALVSEFQEDYPAGINKARKVVEPLICDRLQMFNKVLRMP